MGQVAADPATRTACSTARCIERDFQRLVGSIERAIDMVDGSDRELAIRLANSKGAAERGLALSKQLSRIAR